MAHVRLLHSIRSVFALAGLTLLLTCPKVLAQQFVLFDVTFTFSKEDADNSKPSKSHYYVRGKMLNADRPKDWVKPVDYRNGTVHIRAEVIEKPAGGAPTTWTLCYIPNKGRKNGYGCTGTQVYREKGVYERDVKMTSFWQNDNIVWEEGIKEMHLVMKDDSGGSGHAHKRTDPEKFFPTKMRITMIQVAKGSTYDPKLVPNLPVNKRQGRQLAYAIKARATRTVAPPIMPTNPIQLFLLRTNTVRMVLTSLPSSRWTRTGTYSMVGSEQKGQYAASATTLPHFVHARGISHRPSYARIPRTIRASSTPVSFSFSPFCSTKSWS